MSIILNPYAFGAAFSPSDISGMEVWLDAQAETGFSDGDPVSTWSDQSGNGFDATSSGSNRPLWKDSIINGQAVMRFDGTDDKMTASGVSAAQPNTVFVVFQKTTSLETDVLFDGATTRQQIWTEAGGTLYAFAGTVQNTGDVPGASVRVVSGIFDGASSEFWMDGTSILSGANPGTNSLVSLKIGWDGGETSGYQFGGDIAEIIIYNGALSTSDREAVQDYLGDKYGVTIA